MGATGSGHLSCSSRTARVEQVPFAEPSPLRFPSLVHQGSQNILAGICSEQVLPSTTVTQSREWIPGLYPHTTQRPRWPCSLLICHCLVQRRPSTMRERRNRGREGGREVLRVEEQRTQLFISPPSSVPKPRRLKVSSLNFSP